MQQHQKKITGLIAAIICILSLSLFFWLRPDATQDIPTATPTSTQDNATSTKQHQQWMPIQHTHS